MVLPLALTMTLPIPVLEYDKNFSLEDQHLFRGLVFWPWVLMEL